MYRKYYSYSDMPQQIKPHMPATAKECVELPAKKSGNILGGFENDDLILAAVLAILLMDGCNDKLLIAAVAMLLLSDK